jgi:hypothetical protein
MNTDIEQKYFVWVDKNLYPVSKAFKYNIRYDSDKFFIDSLGITPEKGVEILTGKKEYLKRLLGLTERDFEK